MPSILKTVLKFEMQVLYCATLCIINNNSLECCFHALGDCISAVLHPPPHPFSEAKSQIAIVVAFFSLFTSFNLGTAIVAESLYGRVGNFSTASP